jgi:hypothetical protein
LNVEAEDENEEEEGAGKDEHKSGDVTQMIRKTHHKINNCFQEEM